jgi:hypothetical protein
MGAGIGIPWPIPCCGPIIPIGMGAIGGGGGGGSKTIQQILKTHYYMLVTRNRVWTSNWIYCILITRNYK